MKYFIITYGCQMQRADSERISTVLEKMGYQKNPNEKGTDLIVVNMCSIRQSAVDRVYGLIPKLQKLKDISSSGKDKTQELKNKKPELKTVLTGCILNKDRKIFAKYFDYILDIKDLINWPEKLKLSKNHIKPFASSSYQKPFYLNIPPKYKNTFSVFIPISTGCNNSCAYCVVPFTRGPLVCRDHRSILEEIKNAVENGAKEIWLLGQNVNDYYSPANATINFTELLEMANNIPGDFWIRFTSPHPKDFSDELIEIMAKCRKVTPYLNLPVQSGDNEILRRMRRPYSVERYKSLVSKIRKAFKKHREGLESEIAISTDVIVGFPGETKKQFQNTVNLFKEIKFDMAYISQYSPRPGTMAAKMKNNVSSQEKKKREKELTDILKKTSLANNKKFIGEEASVLVAKQKNGFLLGKNRHYKTVKIKSSKNLVNKLVRAKIVNVVPFGLNARLF